MNGAVNPHYGYDANGNMVCEFVGASCGGSGVVRESATWTAFNMAAQITQGTGSVNLTYDSEHARILQHRQFASTVEDTTYLNDPATGALEEHVVLAGTTTWRDYVQADGHVVAEKFSGATVALRYMVSDHLGSVAVLTDQTGAVVERDAYDAWGKRRNLNGTDDTACALTSQTTRGFTGHEHIDDLCLIDANARLYDPILGRFLSPDDVVPEPYDMQSFNRFSYVRNRPLSVTDPTGHDDGCAVQECAPGDGWRMGNDDDAEGGFLNITDGMGDTLPGLTSWGSNAAGAADATAGTAAPSAPTGGSKPQNDRRNAEKYWKLTHYHQNADGTWTVASAYVRGSIDADGYMDVVAMYGNPTVKVEQDTSGGGLYADAGDRGSYSTIAPAGLTDLRKNSKTGIAAAEAELRRSSDNAHSSSLWDRLLGLPPEEAFVTFRNPITGEYRNFFLEGDSAHHVGLSISGGWTVVLIEHTHPDPWGCIGCLFTAYGGRGPSMPGDMSWTHTYPNAYFVIQDVDRNGNWGYIYYGSTAGH